MRISPLLVLTLLLVGCGGDPGVDQTAPPAADSETEDARADEAGEEVVDCGGTAAADFPDVVDARVEPAGEGSYTVSATLCSAYDTPVRYADAWRVSTPDGEVLGVRELVHDHASEQPFTRSLSEPIDVPRSVDTLVVEGRDLANGWGGATVEVDVPDTG